MQLWRVVLSEVEGLHADMVKGVRFLEYHKWYLDNGHFNWARGFFRPASKILHQATRNATEIHFLYAVDHFYILHFH